MTRAQAAAQMRRALQIFTAGLTNEQAMEVAAVFDPWRVGKTYAAGDFLTCGTNRVGDPQLYKVLQAHIAQADWTPDIAVSLYDAIGLDADGYPVWCQPAGAHDAYQKGDVVNYKGILYQSLMDGNVYSPEACPGGWSIYTEGV